MGRGFYIYVSPIDKNDPKRGWKVKWEFPDRTGGSKNFRRKPDADRHARQVQHDFETNTHVRRQDGEQTFGTYARGYVDSTKRASLTERSWINLDGRLRNHLLPVLGEEPLGAIDAERVRLLLTDLTLEKGLSAATVKPVYNLLNKIMSKAVIERKIVFNPCVGIDARFDLPQEEQGPEMLFLNHDEIELLANTIDPRYRALIYTAAYSGLRAGELWALKRDKLDLPVGENGKIKVHYAQSEPHGRRVVKSTKNRRRREVWIPSKVAHVLREHLLACPSPDGLVFTAPGGGGISHNNFSERFYIPAVERAKVPRGADHRLRFHDLRHTAAAIWISEGCSRKQLQALLGDTSRAIERYEHLFDGHQEPLMERIDGKVAVEFSPTFALRA